MAEILSGGGGTPLKLNTGGLVKHLSEGSSALTEEEKKRLAQSYQSYNSDGASTPINNEHVADGTQVHLSEQENVADKNADTVGSLLIGAVTNKPFETSLNYLEEKGYLDWWHDLTGDFKVAATKNNVAKHIKPEHVRTLEGLH